MCIDRQTAHSGDCRLAYKQLESPLRSARALSGCGTSQRVLQLLEKGVIEQFSYRCAASVNQSIQDDDVSRRQSFYPIRVTNAVQDIEGVCSRTFCRGRPLSGCGNHVGRGRASSRGRHMGQCPCRSHPHPTIEVSSVDLSGQFSTGLEFHFVRDSISDDQMENGCVQRKVRQGIPILFD